MLTDTAVRKAVRRAKAYKLTDGGGLYVHVMPTGRKYWRYRYQWQGKERVLSFGEYPAMQPPGRGLRAALVRSMEGQTAPEPAGKNAALAVDLVVTLVVAIPAHVLPRQVAETQAERIVVEAAARRPGRADVVPSAFHARRLDAEILTSGIRTRRVGRWVAGPPDRE